MDLYTLFSNLIIFTPILLFVHYRGMDFVGELYQSGKEKVDKVRELRKLAKDNNVSIKKVILTVLSTLYSILYYSIIQKINKTVRKLDKNTYEVTYCISGKVYKFNTKARRGMSDVLQIVSGDQDVTEEIEPFLGPKGDFHGFEYTPSGFEYSTLTFNMVDGNVITFSENEILKL
jgi:hypothetical protein